MKADHAQGDDGRGGQPKDHSLSSFEGQSNKSSRPRVKEEKVKTGKLGDMIT